MQPSMHERLLEQSLVERLGVSRSPLRLVLNMLQQEGLVEALPSGGYVARVLTAPDLADMIDLRAMIEGAAARRAAERRDRDAETFERMRQASRAMESVLASDWGSDVVVRYFEHDRQFHNLLVQLADSYTLARSLKPLRLPLAPKAGAGWQMRPPTISALLVTQAHHHALCDAIGRRDALRAESVAREHWRNLSESPFCESDEVGLEIAADGRWYKLYADDDGRLWRGRGWDREGSFEVVDTSDANGAGSYQLNLDIDGNGTILSHPAIGSDGRSMRINNNGVCTGDYARPGPPGDMPSAPETTLDGVPVESIDPAPPPRSAEHCDEPPPSQSTFSSEVALTQAIAGIWSICSGDGVFCDGQSVGLEITPDGKWAKLYADPDGRLWRGVGWSRQGRWQAISTALFNGEGAYQLNFEIDGGDGTHIVLPGIASDGTLMTLANDCGNGAGIYTR